MKILITSAGRRVSLVKAFQIDLRKLFPEGKVFTADINPTLSAACNASDGYFKVKALSDPEFIPNLLNLCLAEQIKLIIPTLDTELQILADNKELFLNEGIQVVISSSEFVRDCRDKRKINKFFEEQGIGIPKSIDKGQPTFPLFIKPYDGSLSVDTYLIKSSEELTSYHLNNEKLLFMEYVSNVDYDEYTVDMYYGMDNQVKCIVPRKRIEVRGGEISKGVTRKNFIVSFLKDKLSFINGAVGCITLQLFLHKSNNRILAIEINPRFGGGFPLSYKAGAEYPSYIIKEFLLHEKLSYFESWTEDLLMLRYDNEVIIHDYVS